MVSKGKVSGYIKFENDNMQRVLEAQEKQTRLEQSSEDIVSMPSLPVPFSSPRRRNREPIQERSTFQLALKILPASVFNEVHLLSISAEPQEEVAHADQVSHEMVGGADTVEVWACYHWRPFLRPGEPWAAQPVVLYALPGFADCLES